MRINVKLFISNRHKTKLHLYGVFTPNFIIPLSVPANVNDKIYIIVSVLMRRFFVVSRIGNSRD